VAGHRDLQCSFRTGNYTAGPVGHPNERRRLPAAPRPAQNPGYTAGRDPRCRQYPKEYDMDAQVAIFGGGCFWCLEPCFLELDGVLGVESGYCGGHVENPGYDAVCSGTTGHAEVVKVGFDPG